MQVTRVHTKSGGSPFDSLRFRVVTDEFHTEYTVPHGWEQPAVALLIEKIFFKGPVPAVTQEIAEDGVPAWLRRRKQDGDKTAAGETDIRAVLHRMAGSWTYQSWKAKLFDGEEDARAFYDEMCHVLVNQIASPEIGLWAAAGIDWAYGIPAPVYIPEQRIVSSPDTDAAGAGVAAMPAKNTLKHVRLFEQKLAIDAGKAAVLLQVENVDSPDFIRLKRDEDVDALAKNIGRKTLSAALYRIMDACDREGEDGFDPQNNFALERAVGEARDLGIGDAAIHSAISYTRQGYEEIPLPAAEPEEAASGLSTVLSIPDAFIKSALTGHGFMLFEAQKADHHVSAEKVWDSLAESVWAAGAPKIFFRNSVQASMPFEGAGVSRTGGFIFPPDAAAPSATLNLLKLDAATIPHTAQLMVLALETAASGPRRPVMLGVTNVAAFLMKRGLAYDSDEGRTTAALAVALMSGAAHRASAAIAKKAGPFADYAASGQALLQNLKDRMSVFSATGWMHKDLMRKPAQVQAEKCPDRALATAAQEAWGKAYVEARDYGLRHAHLTGIDTQPDVQTLLNVQARDINPFMPTVQFETNESIYGRLLNPLVPLALQKLGYGAREIDDITFYVTGHGTLFDAPAINHKTLKEKGFHQAALDALESALKSAQHIRYAFSAWTLGREFCEHLPDIDPGTIDDIDFDMLTALGFSEEDIFKANLYCCGAGRLKGAPPLNPRHFPVFDQNISPKAQVKMQAAVEPCLSGGVAHTLVLGPDAGIDAVQGLILNGWELGVKTMSIYREASSFSDILVPAAAEKPETETETTPRLLLKKVASSS